MFNRSNELMINPIQDGPLWSCSQVKGGRKSPTFPKICHTYPTMMKLGSYTLPEEDPKNVWITWHTHWVLLTSAFFHWKSAKIVSIKIIIILMMSAKLATLGFLNIKVFWNKGYNVIVSVHDVTNKLLSRDSNYVVDVVMWPKFGKSSISMREVNTTSIL